MQLVYYEKLELIDHFDSNDIVLVGEPEGAGWRDYISMVSDDSCAPSCIYTLNIGAKNYSINYFLKYLEYKHGCAAACPENIAGYGYREAEFFCVWEGFVSAQAATVASDIQRLESYMDALPFLSGFAPFFLFLKHRLMLTSDQGILKFFKAWEGNLRNELPFPQYEDAHRYLRQIEGACRQLSTARLEELADQFGGIREALKKFAGSKKLSGHYFELSIIFYCLADRCIALGRGAEVILLCHRCLDFYFESLCKENAINTSGLYMKDKYSALVQRQVLHLSGQAQGWIEEVNVCRNQMLLAHGGCSISTAWAKRMYGKTKDIIEAVNGDAQLWIFPTGMFSVAPLELVDIFSFVPDIESYFSVVSYT